jgi:hypothetical protein
MTPIIENMMTAVYPCWWWLALVYSDTYGSNNHAVSCANCWNVFHYGGAYNVIVAGFDTTDTGSTYLWSN